MFDSLATSSRSAVERAFSKTGVDWQTFKVILKTSLAPTIGLAANEASPWSNVFGSVGYLVPIASIILHPTPPRAGFLRDLVLNLSGVCISAAVTALAIFCVVKAREQSESVVINGVPYNAVASTVAGIWLIVQNYIISAVRYNYPWTIWAASACLVFSNYGMVYAVQFKDMNDGFAFLRQLLWVHFVGFGISTGVALFILPRNCRQPFFDTVIKYTRQVRLAIKRHQSLMESTVRGDKMHEGTNLVGKQHVAGLEALQAKLASQVKDAQLECAWSALNADEIRTLTDLFDEILIPVVSLCQVPDVRRVSLMATGEDRTSSQCEEKDVQESDQVDLAQGFRELLGSVAGPFSGACEIIDKALQYFEAVTPWSISAAGQTKDQYVQPAALEAEIEKAMALLVDCKVDLMEAFDAQRRPSGNTYPPPGTLLAKGQTTDRDDQSQINLQMVLYTLLLLWSTLQKSRALVIWSRQVEQNSNHLILPRPLFLAKPKSTRKSRSSRVDGHWGNEKILIASQTHRHRHFMHPVIAFITHQLRMASIFFASPASGFGLRVSCATMCAAIVCFLPSTQDFYIKQHLVWAQYTVAFTMQGSAGQSLRTLIFRIGGTIVAACLAWISWYIVVGIPAGVLVFYWLSMHVPMYIMATVPRFAGVGVVSAFALTSILGNALQPGNTAAPHSTLVLGAIRLATISVGCLIGTIWTIFPFPASDHDGAKDNLARCLASLADYHTGFHEIVRTRLKTALTKNAATQNRSKLQELELAELHSRLLRQCKSNVQALRTKLKFAKWNLPMDEPFPLALYTSASDKFDSLVRNMQLIAFTSKAFLDFLTTTPLNPSEASSPWLDDPFRTPHGFGVAALLSLLSYSVRTGAPLPWDLQPPSREQMLWKSFDEAEELFKHVKSIRDPGAASFALLRMGTRGLQRDLESLTNVVRDLVGERKFVWEPAGDEELT